MKRLLQSCCALLLMLCGGLALAEEDVSEPPAELSPLLESLTQASLRESEVILRDLERAGGAVMRPLFQSLLDGNLYYDEASLRLLDRRTENGRPTLRELFSGADVGEAEGKISKIRVNNRLRSYLREALARINLRGGTPRQRQAAVRALLDDVDEDAVALLQDALTREEDDGVRGLLEAGIALHQLRHAADPEQRLAAVTLLDGRLEQPIRNSLAALLPGGGAPDADARVQDAARQALARIQARISFYQRVEQLFFGLSLGSVLLLAAIGLAVTFGVMGVINMAHGEMLMLGAYTTYVIQQLMPGAIGASIITAIPAAFLVAGLAGVLIQRFVIRYLHGRPLETLLATFGISLILQQTVRTIFSPLNRRVLSPEWLSGSLQLNPVLSLTYNRLYILVFALLVFVLLLLILKKTTLGLNVRAVAQNRDMARAMGIRTDVVDALTFGLGSGIAGIAGVALSQLTNVGPNLGQAYIIDSFMVVVFGGVGNLFGTLVGAFTLGTANKFLEPATGAVLANILILLAIILFIQKRPKGLFPQKGRAAE